LLLQEQLEIELDLPNIGLNLRQHLNDFLLAKCALAQSAKPRHARPVTAIQGKWPIKTSKDRRRWVSRHRRKLLRAINADRLTRD
jgi:hypothetical protein